MRKWKEEIVKIEHVNRRRNHLLLYALIIIYLVVFLGIVGWHLKRSNDWIIGPMLLVLLYLIYAYVYARTAPLLISQNSIFFPMIYFFRGGVVYKRLRVKEVESIITNSEFTTEGILTLVITMVRGRRYKHTLNYFLENGRVVANNSELVDFMRSLWGEYVKIGTVS